MVIIKRYPNRKLYNTDSKQYITLEGIADLIRKGEEVQVKDHASGEDLTALTLTQIILEQEKKQSGLLSNSFLTNLIRTSEDRLNALQRSLWAPGSFWRQIDEEIQKRIQGLVHQGELTDREGRSLFEKLALQGKRQRDADPGLEDEQVESYLKQHEIPTQADLKKLYDQLDELTAKIEQLNQ
ncbi:MAG: polyhydroxyalkanoate synthesis regulator DNA-binding domain-containing protein [Chloroflexota bacterium]